MRRLESLMTLVPDGNGTKLVYHRRDPQD
jgi:hypothetical protein